LILILIFIEMFRLLLLLQLCCFVVWLFILTYLWLRLFTTTPHPYTHFSPSLLSCILHGLHKSEGAPCAIDTPFWHIWIRVRGPDRCHQLKLKDLCPACLNSNCLWQRVGAHSPHVASATYITYPAASQQIMLFMSLGRVLETRRWHAIKANAKTKTKLKAKMPFVAYLCDCHKLLAIRQRRLD